MVVGLFGAGFSFVNGLPVAWLPAGWKAERDGSIRTRVGRKPCGFVSPALRGYEGLANVETAVDAIKERGARIQERKRELDISVSDLARRSGVSRATVNAQARNAW